MQLNMWMLEIEVANHNPDKLRLIKSVIAYQESCYGDNYVDLECRGLGDCKREFEDLSKILDIFMQSGTVVRLHTET